MRSVAGDILVGVRCDPERITSFARERDANLSNEDHIKLVLDTYLDGRSGYIFVVNPNGARYDALVANRGEGENADWDAVPTGEHLREDFEIANRVVIPKGR
jgi:hypothetical protein